MLPAIGNSNYHAMNVRFDKRLSHGFHFQANYTWSKFIDDAEARAELGGARIGFRRLLQSRRGSRAVRQSSEPSIHLELGVRAARGKGTLHAVAQPDIGRSFRWMVARLHSGNAYRAAMGRGEQTNRTNSFSEAVRPNVVGVAGISGDRSRDSAINRWFNIDAFAAPAQFASVTRPRARATDRALSRWTFRS